MKVLNIHERELEANHERVGALIDSLSSEDDRLWPNHSWPRMKFDRPLTLGQMVDMVRSVILLKNTNPDSPSISDSQAQKDSMDITDTRL